MLTHKHKYTHTHTHSHLLSHLVVGWFVQFDSRKDNLWCVVLDGTRSQTVRSNVLDESLHCLKRSYRLLPERFAVPVVQVFNSREILACFITHTTHTHTHTHSRVKYIGVLRVLLQH